MTSLRARFAMPLLSLALGLSALIAFAGVAQPVAHGQSETVTPAALVLAAQADLAEQIGAQPAAIALLRAEAVTWNDGCLGAAAPGEVCRQALVDGFVLWLSEGNAAHRYHTDIIGNVLRLAASGIPIDVVQEAPLPAGAPPRAAAAATVEGFLSLLAGAGFEVPIALPASGNGGLEDAEAGTPAWVWGVIAAVAAVAVSTGAAYRFWLRGRAAD